MANDANITVFHETLSAPSLILSIETMDAAINDIYTIPLIQLLIDRSYSGGSIQILESGNTASSNYDGSLPDTISISPNEMIMG